MLLVLGAITAPLFLNLYKHIKGACSMLPFITVSVSANFLELSGCLNWEKMLPGRRASVVIKNNCFIYIALIWDRYTMGFAIKEAYRSLIRASLTRRPSCQIADRSIHAAIQFFLLWYAGIPYAYPFFFRIAYR